jgi:prevent-host-death family protein
MQDQKKAQRRSDRSKSGPPSWNLTDAKAQLSRVVQRALDGEPQRIVRSGRDAVVVVAEPAYERANRRGRTAVELFSVLRGAGLDLERDPDPGRDTPL